MASCNKNDIITLELTGMTSEGSAVGHYNGMAVFVAGGAVGDAVSAVVIKAKKTYAIAKILEIITPSADRIEADCQAFPSCGGCVYRHINYQSELDIKKQFVEDCMRRIGGLDNLPIDNTVSNGIIEGYRNKCEFPVGTDKNGRIITGFYSYHSHRIIECDNCRLHSAVFSEINRIFKDWANEYHLTAYDENTKKGLLRHLYIRRAEVTGEICVCIVATNKNISHIDELIKRLVSYSTDIKSIVININNKDTNVILGGECVTVYGSDYIYDVLCGLKIRLSVLSFYQINRAQAEQLYSIAKEYAQLDGTQTVLDLYCGAGTIGLSCADSAKQIIGVEIIPEAIKDAKENAHINGIKNARFICGDAEQAAIKLKNENITPDVILLDPPRKGLTEQLIKTCCDMSPKRIVYVSCNPATQARDLAVFDKLGYRIEKVTPVNMFPRTAHCETVVLMSRAE
ncbi:MAG: 23S rRNA (uracil(1939)-C(5))-methyltransferase RlmD [Clostridiales bacterium]|nr:23S rRNA (uracil(1939)-C(5))-methyltransferase RlmD [Clostridiales bacterium]